MSKASGVIGLDVGTTGVKAVLFDLSGDVVAESAGEYPIEAPHPGWAVQDPDAVADAALEAVAAVATAAGEQRIEVLGIGVSTVMHSLIALGDDGSPLTPSLIWEDQRATAKAEQLRRDSGELAQRTGTPLHPMSPLAKLVWYREEDRETFAATSTWVGIKEYLLRRLCGQLVVDRSVASATGLYNLLTGDWDDGALELAGVRRDQLAELVSTTQNLGGLTQATAERTGLDPGTPVIAGASDGALGNVGLGAVRAGMLACSVGTSGALRVTLDHPSPDPTGQLFCYVLDDDHWIVGGATNNGGNVLRWMHQALAPELPDDTAADQLAELASAAPPGCGGLVMLPYLAGERAPRWTGSPRGVYVGLTHDHRREHLVRAGLEGVCLQLALVLRVMTGHGVDVRSVRATGGFAESRLWRQILADVLGRDIGFLESNQGSALGAAVLGMRGLGLIDSLDAVDKLTPLSAVERPGEAAQVYARLLPIYDALYDALDPAFAAIAALRSDP